MDSEGQNDVNLLLEKVEDITEEWVKSLLQRRKDHEGLSQVTRLRKWSRHPCPSKDKLAGFSSSRGTVNIVYDVEGENDQRSQSVNETLVVKVCPTEGLMAELLTQEGMHHIEVGQYGRFLKVIQQWERGRRREKGGGGGVIMDEILPSHALAVSTERNFTLVLSDLRHYGYKATDIQSGLSEKQVLTAAEKLGIYHGTVVAFKTLTGTHLEEAFPQCFNVAREDSSTFTVFAKPCFEQFKKYWTEDPTRAHLVKSLKHYEDILAPFIVKSLLPEEPFATAMHGDLQASNMFFREAEDGGLTLKLIDWATARYTQGPFDLLYLLNISVDTEVRRRATPQAVQIYFDAFNKALDDLGAGLSYPRSTFDAHLTLGRQLIVIWSIMCGNIFYSIPKLQSRLDAIIFDVITDPEIGIPKL